MSYFFLTLEAISTRTPSNSVIFPLKALVLSIIIPKPKFSRGKG